MRDFFNGVQSVVNYWMLQNGFSIGIGDTVADRETIDAINNAITLSEQRFKQIIIRAQQIKLPCNPGMCLRESFESEVNKELNKARVMLLVLLLKSLFVNKTTSNKWWLLALKAQS